MRVFYSFLILLTSAILFMLPVSEATYDYRTNLQEDTFTVATGAGEVSDNVSLTHVLYDNDTSTITILSNDADDAPAFSSYNTTTRALEVSGLADSTNRTLTVSYDINALSAWSGVSAFADRMNLIWYLGIVAFLVIAIVVMWRR